VIHVSDQLYDYGAQVERTSLAWTRTGLAMLVGTLIMARMTADRLGASAIGTTAVAFAAALAALIFARRRYRKAHRALHRGDRLPDGKLPAVVALSGFLIGAVEVIYAVTGE
jgi:putative membrane protein